MLSRTRAIIIPTTLAFSLSALLARPVAFANDGSSLSPQQAIDRATAAGYLTSGEIELDDGVYEIDARDGSGLAVEVHVEAHSGEILVPPQAGQNRLSAEQINQRIIAAGYQTIDGLEFDDGVWEADVRDGKGGERDLRLHPISGEILSDRRDD
jgi:hypothetical protein